MTTVDLNRQDELRWWDTRSNEYLVLALKHIYQIETLKLVDNFDEWLQANHPHLTYVYKVWKRGNEVVVGRAGDE